MSAAHRCCAPEQGSLLLQAVVGCPVRGQRIAHAAGQLLVACSCADGLSTRCFRLCKEQSFQCYIPKTPVAWLVNSNVHV
jgi:hypothetical protein